MSIIALGRKSKSEGLRPLKPSADLFGVAKLIEEAFAGELDRTGRAALREMRWIGRWGFLLFWLDFLNPEVNTYLNGFVWVEEGRIVGNTTISRQPSNSRRWFISNVAVAKSYRGRGIARAMMDAALEFVRERRGHIVSLQVKLDNIPAVRLYESMNFKTTAAMSFFRAKEVRPPAQQIDFPAEVTCRPHRLTIADARAAFNLARIAIPSGIQQERPLQFHRFQLDGDVQVSNFIRLMAGFGARKYWMVETADKDLVATLNVEPGTWRREHRLNFVVHPDWQGRLEKPLVNLAVRYLAKLPPRPVAFQHPADHQAGVQALVDAGFTIRRTHLWMTRRV